MKKGIIQGGVLNDKRHGYGMMSYYDGDYEDGEWQYDNFKKGKVCWTYTNHDYYIGEILDGKRSGKGKYYYIKNNDYKDGSWYNNNFLNGTVHISYENGYYIGEYSNEKRNGNGKYYFNDGDDLEGKFIDGKLEGYGEERKNGVIYKGNYENGLKHGRLEKISRSGSIDSEDYEYGEKKYRCLIY